jgi:hypothetical protein
LRYHSIKVEFFYSFFGRIEDTKKKLTDLYTLHCSIHSKKLINKIMRNR